MTECEKSSCRAIHASGTEKRESQGGNARSMNAAVQRKRKRNSETPMMTRAKMSALYEYVQYPAMAAQDSAAAAAPARIRFHDSLPRKKTNNGAREAQMKMPWTAMVRANRAMHSKGRNMLRAPRLCTIQRQYPACFKMFL